jgi:SAM-dependent methyltransferase
MPNEAYWESLVDPEGVLVALGIDSTIADVVELGCGYGTFSIPAARRIKGTLTTFDIEPEMVARTRARVQQMGLHNVECVLRDVLHDGFGLPDASQDACLLFNILHTEEPVKLLAEAARVVRPNGEVYATHWRYDETTPRGPSLSIRPRPEDILRWAKDTCRLEPASAVIVLPPYHYGLRLRRLA